MFDNQSGWHFWQRIDERLGHLPGHAIKGNGDPQLGDSLLQLAFPGRALASRDENVLSAKSAQLREVGFKRATLSNRVRLGRLQSSNGCI